MFANLLIHTISVNRPTMTKGTSGGEKATYTTVAKGLPCMVQSVSNNWLVMYAQRKIEVSHSVYFNADQDIRNGDQLLFGARTFVVQGLRDPTEQSRLFIVDCLELL